VWSCKRSIGCGDPGIQARIGKVKTAGVSLQTNVSGGLHRHATVGLTPYRMGEDGKLDVVRKYDAAAPRFWPNFSPRLAVRGVEAGERL
jgi:hypothetical protein